MSKLVAVDPGLRAAGLAVFEDGKLTSVHLVRCDDGEGMVQWRHMAEALLAATPDDTTTLAVEEMKHRDKADKAIVPRILALAYVTGIYVGGFASDIEVITVDPHVWTASLTKAKNEPRIKRRLSPPELAILEEGCRCCPVSNRKELIDAVGIGLYAQKLL